MTLKIRPWNLIFQILKVRSRDLYRSPSRFLGQFHIRSYFGQVYMVNQKLARGMVSQPLFENFQKPEIFTRGSNWSVLLLPKVPISDPWGEVFKTKCFQSFSSCQIETCITYILALDLSSGKISDFCFLWVKTYAQSNNCQIKIAIF